MIRILLAAALVLVALPAVAAGLETGPPGGAYKRFGDLVGTPGFFPGLGTLYVDPKTLPKGPFLAYDRAGRLVSTVYMVDIYYDPGHPGVEEPHYHIVLWHVGKGDAAAVAQ